MYIEARKSKEGKKYIALMGKDKQGYPIILSIDIIKIMKLTDLTYNTLMNLEVGRCIDVE